MYEAKIKSYTKEPTADGAKVSVTIDFLKDGVVIVADDVESFSEPDTINKYIYDKIKLLQQPTPQEKAVTQNAKIDDFLATNPIVNEVVTLPIPEVPDTAKDDYFNAESKLERLKRRVDLGLMSDTDRDYTDAFADAQAKFNIQYLK